MLEWCCSFFCMTFCIFFTALFCCEDLQFAKISFSELPLKPKAKFSQFGQFSNFIPLKIPESRRFSGVFRRYNVETLSASVLIPYLRPLFLASRNQSLDLHCSLTDWFQYDWLCHYDFVTMVWFTTINIHLTILTYTALIFSLFI